MSIARIYQMPGGTLGAYDEVIAAAGDVIAAGAEVHLAGEAEGTLFVVEVWESREALDAWMKDQPEGTAAERALLPEPVVTEFDVHRLLTGD